MYCCLIDSQVSHEEVVGFDVSVDDSALVDLLKHVQQLNGEQTGERLNSCQELTVTSVLVYEVLEVQIHGQINSSLKINLCKIDYFNSD